MKAKWLFLLPLVFAIASCSIYHPQVVSIPLLREKGELQLDASISAASTFAPIPSSIGVNATGSYAINNWWAVQGFAACDMNKNFYLQAATGAFKPFENSVLEGYIGYGFGHSNYENTVKINGVNRYWYIKTGNYNICFGQVNYGFTNLTKAHIDLGVGVKLGEFMPNIIYKKYQYVSDDFDYIKHGELISDELYNTPFFFVEPQVFIRLGSEKTKFCIKAGMDFPSERASAEVTLMDLFDVSLGVTFKL